MEPRRNLFRRVASFWRRMVDAFHSKSDPHAAVRLVVGPDDVLIFRINANLPAETVDRVRWALREQIPGVRIVVLTEEFEVKVVQRVGHDPTYDDPYPIIHDYPEESTRGVGAGPMQRGGV